MAKLDKKIRMLKKKHKQVANRKAVRTLKDFPKMNSSPEDIGNAFELLQLLVRGYRELTPAKIQELAEQYAELKATGNSDWQAKTIKDWVMGIEEIDIEDVII